MRTGEKMRIYIGGLGSSVQESDLEKTFTSPQLGTVQSVEIIRTKGRSFAYLEFLPASDKGLAKLFSTYNGCLWRGGRLKLEKAKEDYLVRLRREWEEDAEVAMKLESGNVDKDESVHAIQKTKKDQHIEKMQLKIFFPKLRKIKPIPLKGTGKHKYSFQRVEVPPLPTHFCDCEEHCGPPESARRNYPDNKETDKCGVNEDELNLMKSILNKLLEKETCSGTISNQPEITEEKRHDALADKWQEEQNKEVEMSDEDNLVINMVGQSSKRATSFEDWGLKSTMNKDSLARQTDSFSNPISENHGTQKEKHPLSKKRKQSVSEDKSNDAAPSIKKGKKWLNHDDIDDLVIVNSQPTEKVSGISCGALKSNKPAWKARVNEKAHTAFNISDILPDLNSEGETNPKSGHLEIAPFSNENDVQQDQSSKHKESDELSNVQTTKTTASGDKSSRGAAWLKKSSWLQLVGDANTSAFNLAQILPGATFQNQELQASHSIDFSNLRRGKQQGFAHKDQESPVEGVGEPQERAHKDIYTPPGKDKVDILNKKQNDGALDGGLPNSDSQETVKKESASAPMLGANMKPNNRAVGDIIISETCPFMRSAASMKEWLKSKAALSGSHKKKGKGKELVQD